jgi:hypothetical protein
VNSLICARLADPTRVRLTPTSVPFSDYINANWIPVIVGFVICCTIETIDVNVGSRTKQ